MALRPAVFDRHILSFDVAGFAQSLEERGNKRSRRRAGRPGVEDADHRHLLLRAPSERPCRHCAGEKNYEIASPHARPLALTASRDYGSRGPPRIGCDGQLSTLSRPANRVPKRQIWTTSGGAEWGCGV